MTPADSSAAFAAFGIGHNGGPPLDRGAGWRHFCWKKAHARAWKTPPREIALARLARAEALGLSGRVRFHLSDYREVQGRFDRIVSVGMLEHVGVRHYEEFFGRVRDLLTEDGVAVVHAQAARPSRERQRQRPRRDGHGGAA